jgi:glutathione synthase/RimK-type ligase-like ATP-grasp enzyme
MEIAGIDILESDSRLFVSECNSAPNWSGLQRATGVDAAEEIAQYVLGKVRA